MSECTATKNAIVLLMTEYSLYQWNIISNLLYSKLLTPLVNLQSNILLIIRSLSLDSTMISSTMIKSSKRQNCKILIMISNNFNSIQIALKRSWNSNELEPEQRREGPQEVQDKTIETWNLSITIYEWRNLKSLGQLKVGCQNSTLEWKIRCRAYSRRSSWCQFSCSHALSHLHLCHPCLAPPFQQASIISWSASASPTTSALGPK